MSPRKYQYREDDWLDILYAMDVAALVTERLRISESTYFKEIHPIVKCCMCRRGGVSTKRLSILRYEVEDLLYRWTVKGFGAGLLPYKFTRFWVIPSIARRSHLESCDC